jgi:energy-coupling factor transporter transmembrane protein EcfT
MIRSFQKQFHMPQLFAYGLLAAWGIFPEMLQEYRRTKAAFRARGIRVFAVSPALLKPLLVKSIRWSEQLSVAMESKGFSGHQSRTEYDPVRVHPLDLLGVVVCCVAFPVVMAILKAH